MCLPRIEIFLDENHDLCVGKVEQVNAESRIIFRVELNELRSLAPEDAAYRVGGSVLNILKIWHKKEFENWEVPPPTSR